MATEEAFNELLRKNQNKDWEIRKLTEERRHQDDRVAELEKELKQVQEENRYMGFVLEASRSALEGINIWFIRVEAGLDDIAETRKAKDARKAASDLKDMLIKARIDTANALRARTAESQNKILTQTVADLKAQVKRLGGKP